MQKHLTINKCCGFWSRSRAVIIAVLVLAFGVMGPAAPSMSAPAGGLPVVVVDPGHGGNDIGASGPAGQQEKKVCLDLARRLESALTGKARVVLTRAEDYGISLAQRAARQIC